MRELQTGGGAAAVAPLGSASIAGVINFEGAPPANPTIDMAEEPDCVAKYTDGPIDPIVVVNDGKLANVYVRIVSGLPEGPYPMLSGNCTAKISGPCAPMCGPSTSVTVCTIRWKNTSQAGSGLFVGSCHVSLTARCSPL